MRVLIVSASIGGGHVAAARALRLAFEELGAEASDVDLLEYTALPFRRFYRQAYFDLVRTVPDLVEWFGRRLDRRPSETKTLHGRLRARVTRLLAYEMPRLIDRYQPDVLVHTHFLGAEIVSGRLRRRRALPQAVVVTDFFAHSLWLQPGVARYFVASDDVKAQLLSAGVDEHRIRVTGIPIDPRFSALPSAAEAREQLRFSTDQELLLLLASGLAADDLRAILKQLLALRWQLQVVVVCGRSSELLAVAHDMVAEASGLVTFRVLGFVTDMPLLMAAADLAISKPGGLASSEALAARLPLMLVSPYPVQEEINANHLLEHGAAVMVEPLSTLSHKLRKLLAEPQRLAEMRTDAAMLAHPGAALAVGRAVLEELLGNRVGALATKR